MGWVKDLLETCLVENTRPASYNLNQTKKTFRKLNVSDSEATGFHMDVIIYQDSSLFFTACGKAVAIKFGSILYVLHHQLLKQPEVFSRATIFYNVQRSYRQKPITEESQTSISLQKVVSIDEPQSNYLRVRRVFWGLLEITN